MAQAEGGLGPHLVGSCLPVTVGMVAGDALVVSLAFGERSFSGVLLDAAKKFGACSAVDLTSPKSNHHPPFWDAWNSAAIPAVPTPSLPPPSDNPLELQPCTPPQASVVESAEKALQSPALPVALPPCHNATGPELSLSQETCAYPPPLLLRQTYGQFRVPQPPIRRIKRAKRRTARNDPSKLIVSSITLRPRRVLCEKCKSAVSDKSHGGGSRAKSRIESGRRNSAPCSLIDEKLRKRRVGDADLSLKRLRRDSKAEHDCLDSDLVQRSPVIKISYNTPQGKGEVVKIPSKVSSSFGQVKNGKPGHIEDEQTWRPAVPAMPDSPASIPKLRLTRPSQSQQQQQITPKIRLRPRGPKNGDTVAVYTAELVNEQVADSLSREDEFDRVEPQSPYGNESETRKVIHLRIKRTTEKECSDQDGSPRTCRSDASDESAESCHESVRSSLHSSDISSDDFPPDGPPLVSHGERENSRHRAVPPLTVRVRTADTAITECYTPDGRKVHVGEVVWAKIHGFPWWPACVLGLSPELGPGGQQESGEALVSWFGSHTTSAVSLAKLAPFQEQFCTRLDRKRKGCYRQAVFEAARTTKRLTPEVKEWLAEYKT
uniref:PWWP domain-containing protein 2B isoform X1 n=1 Tax=Myxine glutinosa TaxID=7769 RepID=UPI00358FF78F